jgi:hypothetical protein
VPLNKTDAALNTCTLNAATDPKVTDLCGAVVDVTGNPATPPYAGHNDTDMLYVGSLAKIYSAYVAFELKKRVEMQAKSMITQGLSTAKAGWEKKVFDVLKKGWQPKLNAAFPSLPSGFPKFTDMFVLSAAGDVTFAEASPAITDADLDAIGEFGNPKGKYRDWMRLMLRWSNNTAASKTILPLSYPYINGVLGSAGFFDKAAKAGLWLSGDYMGHDWAPGGGNPAGQPLTVRWAKAQGRTKSNFTGTSFQVARFMTALAQGKLADAASSADMVSITTGADGIGSYIGGALASASPPRRFTSVVSKIGYGDDSFSHDCAIVTASAPAIRYASAVLGSPPSKGRADLDQLSVAYYDCVAARHP